MTKTLITSLMLAASVAVCSAATTYTWTGAANDGILNTPGNWSPAMAAPSASDTHILGIPAGEAAELRLDADFPSYDFTISGGSAVSIDLGGHALSADRMGFETGSPIRLRNGELRIGLILRLGKQGDPEMQLDFALDDVVAVATTSTTDTRRRRYAKSIEALFTRCTLTNFPVRAWGSNSRITLDASTYSTQPYNLRLGPADGVTNSLLRLVNGSTLFARNNGTSLGSATADFRNVRFVFESGSTIPYAIYLNGSNNVFAATNTTISTDVGISGEDSAAIFHDSTWNYTSSTPSSLSGYRNGFVFSGANANIAMESVNLGTSTNCWIKIPAGSVVTNENFSTWFHHSRDGGLEVGEGATFTVYHMGLTDNYANYVTTNATWIVRPGATLNLTARGDTSRDSFNGVGLHVIVDNGCVRYVRNLVGMLFQARDATYELNGDDAKIWIGSDQLTGYAQIVNAPRLVFRPGPEGYHGQAPIFVRNVADSRLNTNTVFVVDATEFARGKPGGTLSVPLIVNGASFRHLSNDGETYVRYDATVLDSLNAIGEFTPSSGRLVIDADGNLAFSFRRDAGTRLMVK